MKFRKTLPSLERPVHVVEEWELITQNYEWKKKKKKKREIQFKFKREIEQSIEAGQLKW